MLRALAVGEAVSAPVLAVVAHPDDETVGFGGRIGCLGDLTLVHLTDGAPDAPDDWRRAGFADREAYARARARELDEALSALGAAPRRHAFGVRDQQAALHLVEIARRLAPLMQRAEVVLTHAYEGGHPDHDAAAFAVWAAGELTRRNGGAGPLILEFTGYHLREGRRVAGRFLPDPDSPALPAPLTRGQLRRKRAALAAHATQTPVLAWFDPAVEAYRQAPACRFTRPPPPGAALYDPFGWAMTSARWRELARTALAELGLAERRP